MVRMNIEWRSYIRPAFYSMLVTHEFDYKTQMLAAEKFHGTDSKSLPLVRNPNVHYLFHTSLPLVSVERPPLITLFVDVSV
jgi:hypothetical protein